jgi:hypothetical protein
MHQVGIVEDSNPNRPLEGRERIMKWTPHLFIVGYEARSLTGALKKMAQCFSSIGEGGSGSGYR